MWVTEGGIPGLMRVRNEMAVARGLKFRPLSVTARDALSWYEGQPPDRQPHLLQGINGIGSIEESMMLERKLLDRWLELHSEPHRTDITSGSR